MKKSQFIILFAIISSLCKGQNDSILSIMQKKPCWCDSMQPYFVDDNYTDTISYEALIKTNGWLYANPVWKKGASPGFYGWGTVVQIDSYEMNINNDTTRPMSIGYHKFKKEKSLRKGGIITITNCKIKCWLVDSYQSKEEYLKKKPAEYTHIIKKFVFHILPAK